MENGDYFDKFLRNSSNYNGGELEFYEDVHDANGNYTGSRRSPYNQNNGAPQYSTPSNAQPQQPSYAPPPQYGTPQQTPPQYYAQPAQPTGYTPPPTTAAQRTEYNLGHQPQFAKLGQTPPTGPMPLPTDDQYIPPQLNQSFVLYRPQTTADVEQLIAYLRRREPALVDLDPIADSPDAQRLMDFTSGAAYALGDRVMTIRRNLFLITPDTIDVLKPENDDK